MDEYRYQYLNSLSLEEFDRETSFAEQRKFCDYQFTYHPKDAIYFQVYNPD